MKIIRNGIKDEDLYVAINCCSCHAIFIATKSECSYRTPSFLTLDCPVCKKIYDVKIESFESKHDAEISANRLCLIF